MRHRATLWALQHQQTIVSWNWDYQAATGRQEAVVPLLEVLIWGAAEAQIGQAAKGAKLSTCSSQVTDIIKLREISMRQALP